MNRLWRTLAILVLLAVAVAVPVMAQEAEPDAAFQGPPPPPLLVGGIDYSAWRGVAERAAQLSEGGQGSNFALERLRTDIAEWRDRFAEGMTVNEGRISTLQSQIAALGPAPGEEGAVPEGETDLVTQRRAELVDELSRLRVPSLLAEEANAQATGLIAELDTLLRQLDRRRLLQRGASPLAVADWPVALAELGGRAWVIPRETIARWQNEARRDRFLSALPVTVGLILTGLVLLLRGRRWVAGLGRRWVQSDMGGRGAWRVLISLFQVVLPFAGLMLLTIGLTLTEMLGTTGERFAAALPALGLYVIAARWIAMQVFPPDPALDGPFSFPPEQRITARRLVVTMGWVVALGGFVEVILSDQELQPVTFALADFPFQLVLGAALFLFGRLILRSARRGEEAAGASPVFLRIAFARVAMFAGIAGPVLGVLGYQAAQNAVIVPTLLSLAVVAVLLLLQRFVHDVYELVTGRHGQAADRLAPVLIASALVLASLPVLALIWGARVGDLAEIWARFQAGIAIGDARFSPSDFVTFALIFGVGYALTRFLQATLRTSILPKTDMDVGGRNALVSGVGYVGIFAAALAAITGAGLDLSSLAIVAGALSVGIGFGLQNIVSNFVSGIILLIERPIGEGDWIEVNGQMGYVRAISVRSTRIETFDRTDVIIPNADLVSGQVTNWTRGNSVGRVIVPVGVAYGSDVPRVMAILQEVAEGNPMVILTPPPAVLFAGFGADSLDFEIRAILRDVNFKLSVKSEMNQAINTRFAEAGIEIPFAQRDLWLRNPEALRGTGQES